jgi:O-antigen ligase
MEATTQLEGPQDRRDAPTATPAIDLELVATWLLAFGLVVYLGMRGGGFDPLISDKVGVVVWWIVLAGLLVGAFPRRRLGMAAYVSVALLACFLAWTALSLAWTESHGNTHAEIAHVATYLGVFVLGLFSIRGADGLRPIAAAVGTGIAALATIALLSRLHPAWFPDADQTGNFLHSVRNRLSYPLDYWNGVGALTAIGLPLLLNMASTARSVLLRSLCAAALPAMALTIYLTISRGGILAGAAAVIAYIAFAGDRVPRLATTAVAGIGGALLIGAASQRDAFQEGLSSAAAHHQGNEMLWLTTLVCLAVALIQAGISLVLAGDRRPSWTYPGRTVSIAATAGAVLVLLVAAAALNLPHRISNGLDEFKSGNVPAGNSTRLTSAAGEQRYKLWGSALDEFSSEPLHGTGAGTFELWWARNGKYSQVVRDTHSLYLQTLAELGMVGILLLGGFLVLVLASGARTTLRADARDRPVRAAALAGVVAFMVSAALDWVWQLPVLPVAAMLLMVILVTSGIGPSAALRRRMPVALRAGLAVLCLAAIVAIAIPLSSSSSIRESQSQVRGGDLGGALKSAQSAADVEPGSALPRLQQALILEQAGDYRAAVAEASAATERETKNWKNWLVLSRVQAEAGNSKAAVASYRMARSLNPTSPLFDR